MARFSILDMVIEVEVRSAAAQRRQGPVSGQLFSTFAELRYKLDREGDATACSILVSNNGAADMGLSKFARRQNSEGRQ